MFNFEANQVRLYGEKFEFSDLFSGLIMDLRDLRLPVDVVARALGKISEELGNEIAKAGGFTVVYNAIPMNKDTVDLKLTYEVTMFASTFGIVPKGSSTGWIVQHTPVTYRVQAVQQQHALGYPAFGQTRFQTQKVVERPLESIICAGDGSFIVPGHMVMAKQVFEDLLLSMLSPRFVGTPVKDESPKGEVTDWREALAILIDRSDMTMNAGQLAVGFTDATSNTAVQYIDAAKNLIKVARQALNGLEGIARHHPTLNLIEVVSKVRNILIHLENCMARIKDDWSVLQPERNACAAVLSQLYSVLREHENVLADAYRLTTPVHNSEVNDPLAGTELGEALSVIYPNADDHFVLHFDAAMSDITNGTRQILNARCENLAMRLYYLNVVLRKLTKDLGNDENLALIAGNVLDKSNALSDVLSSVSRSGRVTKADRASLVVLIADFDAIMKVDSEFLTRRLRMILESIVA